MVGNDNANSRVVVLAFSLRLRSGYEMKPHDKEQDSGDDAYTEIQPSASGAQPVRKPDADTSTERYRGEEEKPQWCQAETQRAHLEQLPRRRVAVGAAESYAGYRLLHVLCLSRLFGQNKKFGVSKWIKY